MSYSVLGLTALIMAIVAVASLFRELYKFDEDLNEDLYLKRRNDDIGDEAWRLIMKKEQGESHTSKVAGEILTSNKEKSHGEEQ